MTLHISLPKELERLVHEKVKSGLYSSASEVVREALRNMFSPSQSELSPEEQEALDAIVLPRLRALHEGHLEISGRGIEHLGKLRENVLREIGEDGV